MEDMQDDWTVVPTMRNLWAFDWKCYKCGKRTYQGPTPIKCDNCGCTDKFKRKLVWEAKTNPQSNSYCFDSTPHFNYFKEFSKRPEGQGDLTETMSLQGSCFMLTRDKWFELNICDESLGSWGSQGIEVAVKTWLSGGRVIVNHKTFYGHMFRTQGGDFSFPYHMPQSKVSEAKNKMRDMLFNNKLLDKQVHSLSWLVAKFWLVPGWDKIPEDTG
jgi:ribosomal protein L37E